MAMPNTSAEWEIGVAEITGPNVRWTGEYVSAPNEAAASELAADAGYYRNLRLRPGASRIGIG